jgi:hypothetical protein
LPARGGRRTGALALAFLATGSSLAALVPAIAVAAVPAGFVAGVTGRPPSERVIEP